MLEGLVVVADLGLGTQEVAIQNGDEPSALTAGALARMLAPTQIHVVGCLHSHDPEVTIQETYVDSETTSRLAKSVYFRRCDGIFKNIMGEKLA